jgi:hypothetical protein
MWTSHSPLIDSFRIADYFRLNCRVRYLREVAISLIFRIPFIRPYSDRSAFIGSTRAALRAGT